jgi:hypothetical protein
VINKQGDVFIIENNYSTTITDYFSYCEWWKYWCKTAVTCISSDILFSVEPYLIAPYGFWKHTNNTTGKESVFLNTANNNFLEGTNYNCSCTQKTSPGKRKTDYVMPELRTINSMPNIPSCSTIVVLPTKEVTPITNYCLTIKNIKNMETQSIGIKSLSGTGDVKVTNWEKSQFYL